MLAMQSACPGATRGALPEGWTEHVGQLSCSETCRELLQSMGLVPEEEMHSARRSGDEDVHSSVSESRSTTLPPKELRSSSAVYAGAPWEVASVVGSSL